MVCSSTHSLVPIIHAHLNFYSVHGLLFATNKRYTASDAILIQSCYYAGTGSRLALLPEPVMTFDPENTRPCDC